MGKRIQTGQWLDYGESHPLQTVWVRNGETVLRAIRRRVKQDRRRRLNASLLIFLCVLLCGCASILVTHGIPNWQRVQDPGPGEGGLYCGGLPDTNGWQVLQALGVRRVINLTPTPDPQIPGMLMLQFPMTDWQQEFGLVGSQIEEALRAMDTPGPVFVHCQHGMNRTRTIIALWRMRHYGWSRERSVHEANEFGWGSSFRKLKEAVK